MDYGNIYQNALSQIVNATDRASSAIQAHGLIESILARRLESKNGISANDAALLLSTLRNQDLRSSWPSILAAASILRARCYGTHVATMVPIEIGSYCSSNCAFCGWRRDTSAMLRLRVKRRALISQVRHLAKMGFSHFELSGGDDLIFLQSELYDTVKAVKSVIDEVTCGGRLSICLTPLMAQHYDALREVGLDTVLTWQETYDRTTFQTLISKGPKANGIDDNFQLVRGGDGFLSRASSQERAVKAGLQVGIGVMLGLAPCPEADILSTILHGQHLLYLAGDSAKPLIIGMPTWNPITTSVSDNRSSWHRPFEVNEVFEIIGAIYLLCFPDFKAWIFPNCRVPMETQISTIKTAGVFTSTMVRVGPGAYLADTSGEEVFQEIFQASSEDTKKLTRQDVLQGEQFQHHFHSHADYLKAFRESGIHVVTDATLLKLALQ